MKTSFLLNKKTFYLSIATLFVVLFDYGFLSNYWASINLATKINYTWVSSGVVLGLIIISNKKQAFLVSGLFLLATLAGLFYLREQTIFVHLLVSVTMVPLIGGLLRTVYYHPDLYKEFTTNSLIIGVVAFTLIPIIVGLIPVLFCYIISTSNFIDLYLFFLERFFLGYVIFTSPITFIHVFSDTYWIKSKTIPAILFLFIFGFSLYLIHQNLLINEMFLENGFFMLVVFFIAGFFFGTYMLIYTAAMTITIHYYFYINLSHFDYIALRYLQLQLEIYLFILISLLLFSKVVIFKFKKNNEELKKTNKQLDQTIKSTYELLKLSVDQNFQTKTSSKEYLKRIFTVAVNIFDNFDAASCYIKGDQYVEFLDAVNYDVKLLNSYKFPVADFEWTKEEPSHIVNSKRMVKQSLKDNYEEFVDDQFELKESITFRIFIKDDVVGGLSFDNILGRDRKFTQSDYTYMKRFQKLMNSFYYTTSLTNKNNLLKDDIVLSLIRTLEVYDLYTGGHSEDVAGLSKMIAVEYGLSPEETKEIFWAGLVHDIGKIGIPQEIINKTTKLTQKEYNLIKDHSKNGYQILKKSGELQNIAMYVRHHHEWYNGTGYPDGLAQEDIPIQSRIMCVCDAVSSMATKRPYADKKTLKEIKEELIRYKAVQFDPEIVEIMVSLIDNKQIKEHYEE